MKAAQVLGFGDVDRIAVVDLPNPNPGADSVLVRVKACGLNYADVLQRQGLYLGGPLPPFVPGWKPPGSSRGTVPAHPAYRWARAWRSWPTGGFMRSAWSCEPPGVSLFQTDVVRARGGVPRPLPHGLSRAHHGRARAGRRDRADSCRRWWCGTAAVQIARLLGLRVVATASTEEKRRKVRALGATSAVRYDDFEVAVRDLTGGMGPDIVLESLGGDVFRRSLAMLAPLGRLVVLGAVSGQVAPIDGLGLVFRSQGVLGFHLKALLRDANAARASVGRLLEWFGQGDLDIQVGHEVAFTDIRLGHQLVASRDRYGAVVLVH